MKKPAKIALHTDELDSIGVSLKRIERSPNNVIVAHRDDHYMFILQEKGRFVVEVDFDEVKLSGPSVCFIAPGQVHRYISRKDSTGWFIFADIRLVADSYRAILDTYEHLRQVIAADKNDVLFKSAAILDQLLASDPGPLNASIITQYTTALLGICASRIIQSAPSDQPINSQRYHITNQFKQLVRKHFKNTKQVQEYAGMLNISPLYLNEVIREITGFPASYWIQQEITLEAKRLLYHTTLDVKQIAYELGYEDHAYFSRFFKKNTAMTALEFRAKNHDMSNHRH